MNLASTISATSLVVTNSFSGNTCKTRALQPFHNQYLYEALISVDSKPLTPIRFRQQLPQNQHLHAHLASVASTRLITPVNATLTGRPSPNSFRSNTYKKHRGALSF